MRRILILCMFFLLNATSGESATTSFTTFQPLEPASFQNYGNNLTNIANPFAQTANINYYAITKIEKSLFGRTYKGQNIAIRLSRIEKALFSTTYPNSNPVQRLDNIISNFNQMNKYPNISKNTLSRIETRIFNQNFSQNNVEHRIERLEQELFGAVQSGDIDSRYQAIKMAYKNQTKKYYPTQVAQNGWKGLVNNLGNTLLGGSMTGFTPPINPYNYNNGYNKQINPFANGHGIYRGSRVNNGPWGYSYSDEFNDFGNGAGVTILD